MRSLVDADLTGLALHVVLVDDGCTDGTADAVKTAIGYLPTLDGLDTEGLDVSAADMAALLSVDTDGWKAALPQFEAHLAQFGDKLPAELTTQLQRLAAAL